MQQNPTKNRVLGADYMQSPPAPKPAPPSKPTTIGPPQKKSKMGTVIGVITVVGLIWMIKG